LVRVQPGELLKTLECSVFGQTITSVHRSLSPFLTEKPRCGKKQPVPLPCKLGGDPGVSGRGQPQTMHARQPAQRPLTPDDCVVAKRSERKPFCPLPATARRSHGRERYACAQRIEPEVPRPTNHPARMPSCRTEADPARVQGDSVRPLRERRTKRRVTSVCCGRNGERNHGQRAQHEHGDPAPGLRGSATDERRQRNWLRGRRQRPAEASCRSLRFRPARRSGCPRLGRPLLGRRPARWPPPG
jgi:hypothetical protein